MATLDEGEAYELCQEAVRIDKISKKVKIGLCIILDKIIETNAAENSATGGLQQLANQLSFSRGKISKYAKIGRVLVREYGFTVDQLIGNPDKPIPTENLYYVASAESRVEAESLLLEAASKTSKDFKNHVKKVDECDHAYEPIGMERCAKCNDMRRVYGVDNSFDTETGQR